MKKTVKSLIIAASVAAVAGIGAVSFAAWNSTDAGRKNDVTGGQNADITFVEFDKAAGATVASVSGTLVPHDQTIGIAASGMNREYIIKLVVKGGNDALAQYHLEGSYTMATDNSIDSTSGFVYKVTSTDNAIVTAADTDITGWETLGESTTPTTLKVSTTTGEETKIAATTYYVHIALNSNVNSDMNQQYTFNFELKAN